MKIRMKRSEIFPAELALQQFADLDLKPKAAYIVAKNLRLIGYEAADLRKAQEFKPDDKERNSEYQEEFNALTEKHAARDQDNKMVQIGMGNVQIADPAAYKVDLKQLNEEYEDIVSARERHTEAVREMMDEVVTVELHAMKSVMLPKQMRGAVLGPLVDLITDMDLDETIDVFKDRKDEDEDDE